MITKNEISSLNLSPTKKDFVQIWNELMEVASKITERWDPTSTNESDPGIVLLKVLTGIADKLNYNIDKNILEAYMPTAAQMESMRKLCELVGYDIKYYQSAETTVRISYIGNTTDLSDANDEKLPQSGLAIPRFTTITNADKDITFVTTNAIPMLITNSKPWVEVPCIEGQISQCESVNNNNLIMLSQLDDNNRYYLPEVQIAENGIFVNNAYTPSESSDIIEGDAWTQVSNLNTQPSDSRVFKFGYDSLEGRPYLAFPNDVGSLIGDGLIIHFIRTSGLSGNISARTLEALEIPARTEWADFSAEQFEVTNVNATTNGANIESISTAYNNFKKTVGTFDTLVTCRDYMNKIYSLIDSNNYPLVSNILVTDIRNDINKAITLCSCNEYGILYKEMPLTKTGSGFTGSSTSSSLIQTIDPDGDNVYKLIVTPTSESTNEETLIDHFDLMLYPFKTFTQVSYGETDLVTPYNKSFTYTKQNNEEFEAALADVKTCAHNFKSPVKGDIVTINNYLRLNALIATSMKVPEAVADSILKNVKVALVNEFNLRNLDFGEEIPFESILSVIENADSRIKVVSLQEPIVLTTYTVVEEDGATTKEYGIASGANIDKDLANETNDNTIYNVEYKEEDGSYCKTAKNIYNKLVLRNILAGRASLFDYDETFISNNSEKPYTVTEDITEKLKESSDNEDITKIIDDVNTTVDTLEQDFSKKAIDAFKALHPNAPEGTTAEYNYEAVPTRLTNEGVLAVLTGFKNGPVTVKCNVQVKQEANSTDPGAIVSSQIYETYEPFKDNTKDNTIINDIAKVEAICEISNESETFENIPLAKNEVIKFRAPNLITTKTFPAYVYYRFEKAPGSNNASGGGNNGGGADEGKYAEIVSLNDFIQNPERKSEIDSSVKTENIKTFFEELWKKVETTKDINEDVKIKKFVAGKTSDNDLTLKSDVDLDTVINTSIAIQADKQLSGSTNTTKIYTDSSTLKNELENHFKNSGPDVEFKYYPLNNATLETWSDYVREYYKSKNSKELPGDTTLWRLSTTTTYPKGRLVIDTHQRLFAQNSEFLATNVNISAGAFTYICTDLGEDPKYTEIFGNSDVELQKGDKLYIHYTPASTNEDGETVNAEPVSIVYTGGNPDDPVIIKPSGFTLMPSEDVKRQGTSWKKTGVTFPGETEGKDLMSLAPNEQIELRSLSRVTLDTPARFYKNFDNIDLELGHSEGPFSYELKDGEYLFYTDQNAQEAAYYGSGSVITLEGGAWLPKTSAEDKVEVSQILSQGLHIVPWSSIVALNTDKRITITEYQYVTLVEGDTLNTLTLDKGSVKNNDNKYTISSAGWLKCDPKQSISYTPAGAESPTELPEISLSTGPSTGWEVCSVLELSTSPGYSQPLRAAEIKSGDHPTTVTNKIKVYTNTGTGVSSDPIEITSNKTVLPDNTEQYETVSVKLNTIAQVAAGVLDTETLKTKSQNESTTKVQMKVFKEDPPKILSLSDSSVVTTPISNNSFIQTAIDLNTINNYWSKVDITTSLKEDEDGAKALNLNFMVPDDDLFGIFSIYLDVPEDRLSDKQNIPAKDYRVFIDIPQEFGKSYDDVIAIFNYEKLDANNNPQHWWTEGIDTWTANADTAAPQNRLYLRAGLNCIIIKKSCNLLIKAEANASGSIIYDNMRLVKGKKATHGVNLDLIDFDAISITGEEINKTELADALLAKIAELDKNHEFYYNAPVENSLVIEFDKFDKNIRSFSNPYTLYDINNINNNFVVSKLDVKYLDTGLKIAKSSRY